MNRKLLVLICMLPVYALSQDISGIWTGYIQAYENKLPFELVISDDLTGYSYTIFAIDGVENIGIKNIKLKQKKDRITFTDDKLIFNNYTTPPRHIKMFGQLMLGVMDSLMTLNGTFQTKTLDFRSQDNSSYSGTITLQKQNKLTRTRLIAKLSELDLLNTLSFVPPAPANKNDSAAATARVRVSPSAIASNPSQQNSVTAPSVSAANRTIELIAPIKPAAELATRKTEILRSIPFTSDSLVLTLYDNGIVDGDTVSVVLNGKVIIPLQGLSEKAYKQVLHITSAMGDSLQLVMYAENLGTIPPNTGLLIVEDGGNRYEVRFEGDLQKSSAVILRRKH